MKRGAWYHSHPFDVDEDHDNCFFSSTDLSTQLSWQNAEDPQGNPFLAIVLDPLRSAAKNSAALAAFRAYPPAYTPPANQCPDGEICADDARRVEVWGSCWHRYYQLDLEYFMSNQARAIVDVLNRSHLWAKTLSESHREDTTDRVAKIADKLARAPGAQPPRAPRLGGYGGLDALGSGAAPSARADQAPLSKAADAAGRRPRRRRQPRLWRSRAAENAARGESRSQCCESVVASHRLHKLGQAYH